MLPNFKKTNLAQSLECESPHSVLKKCIEVSTSNFKSMSKFPNQLTTGVEVEFFAFDNSGKPATIEHTQKFIKEIINIYGWSPSTDRSQADIETSSASRELSNGRYSKLKYEYPPHLMEVAFTFFPNLNDLYREIKTVWIDLQTAASIAGITLKFDPFISPDLVLDISNNSTKTDHLNASREIYLRNQNKPFSKSDLLFTAYTAGTQIQLGGLDWFNNPNLVHSLYDLESQNPLYGNTLAAGDIVVGQNNLHRRVEIYKKCFPNMSLVGFPDLSEWTIDTWVESLLRGPLGYGAPKSLQGFSYLEISPENRPPIAEVIAALRDQQFIKPRVLGTIEFRADPSLNSPEKLIALAAWRLGQAILAINSADSTLPDFRELGKKWQQNRTHCTESAAKSASIAVDRAIKALAARGKGEEVFLKACL